MTPLIGLFAIATLYLVAVTGTILKYKRQVDKIRRRNQLRNQRIQLTIYEHEQSKKTKATEAA